MNPHAFSLKMFTCEDDFEPYILGLFKGNQENDAYFQIKNEEGALSDDLMVVKPMSWTERTFTQLKSHFPNIKHLLIYMATQNIACDRLHLLISKYPQLESLTICGKFNLTLSKQKEEFFYFLNTQMNSLKRLDYRCTDASVNDKYYKYIPGEYQVFYVSPEVLSKLKHFSLVPSFQYYIPEIIAAFGDQLKTLRLDRIPFTELTLEHFQMSFLQLNPPLLSTVTNLSLTALGVESDHHSLQIFHFICKYFKNLEALQFNLPRKSETPLYLEFLKSLTGLRSLKKLHFGFLFLKSNQDENANQPSSSPSMQFSLPSVTDLSFYFIPRRYDSDYFTMLTSSCFPSLESLVLKPTREFTSKYDFLSKEQLKCFPAQMNYEAYASKSDQLLVPSQLSNTVSNGLFSKNIEKI